MWTTENYIPQLYAVKVAAREITINQVPDHDNLREIVQEIVDELTADQN
jgi:hypothetical protein